jgi:hypothetical protein
MITMASVGMMEMAVDEVVDVIVVGDGGVTAVGAVDVGRVVAGALVVGGASGRIGGRDGDDMLVDMTFVQVMQVAVMEVIDMILMLDGGMTAAGGVDMVVIGVSVTSRHK